jgi:hypothetical protein
MTEVNGRQYKYLEPRPDSNYRQLFFRGRKIFAQTLYRATVGEEPRTPEEVARDFNVPVEAVHEAIDYCVHNEPLLRQERERELARIKAAGRDKPPYVPPDYKPE